jgi:hypothetical protein
MPRDIPEGIRDTVGSIVRKDSSGILGIPETKSATVSSQQIEKAR